MTSFTGVNKINYSKKITITKENPIVVDLSLT